MSRTYARFMGVLAAALGAMLLIGYSYGQDSEKPETGGMDSGFETMSAEVESTETEPVDEVMQVWCSVYFIQLDKKDMGPVEEKLGFPLDPIEGKVMLDPEERKKLMDAIDKAPSVEYLGAASLLMVCGCSSQVQLVEEIRYPCEFLNPAAELEKDDEDANKTKPTVDIETREVGMFLTVSPTISADGKVITIVSFPEISTFHRWLNFAGCSFSQPIITSWNTSTCWVLKDGYTVVSKSIPARAFRESEVFEPRIKTQKTEPKTALLVFSTKIVTFSTEEEEE